MTYISGDLLFICLISVNIIDDYLSYIKYYLKIKQIFYQEAHLKRSFDAGIAIMFLIYVILSPFSMIFAQQKIAKRIAVLELQGEGVSLAEARTLTDRLRSRLVNTNVFHVLEREQMDEILGEQGFQQSGCVSDECAVEVGQLIGVQLMVAGSIGKIGNLYTSFV